MEFELFQFPFSKHFNLLMYLGVWATDSKNQLVVLIYWSYRLITLLVLITCIMCQGIDFWMAIGNIEKMTYNLCTSVVTVGTTLKLLILLQRTDKLNHLREHLWRDYYRYNEPEDELIKKTALREMDFVTKMFQGATVAFLPICLLLGYFSYLWGPRELPFPSFFPINYENSFQYNIVFVIELYCGSLILGTAMEIDLVVYSMVLQIAAQYKILHKDILKLNDLYCEREEAKKKMEVNFLLMRKQTEIFLKQIVSRQRRLTQYVKRFEWGFNENFFIQILGGSILIIANGLQVLKMSYTINHKLAYEIVYLIFIIVDIYYNCHYVNILTKECKTLADAAYSIVWYKMDAELQKYLLMVIIQAQRPPKITAGKLFEVDLKTFLSLLRNTYSWLMLFRQIEMSA